MLEYSSLNFGSGNVKKTQNWFKKRKGSLIGVIVDQRVNIEEFYKYEFEV